MMKDSFWGDNGPEMIRDFLETIILAGAMFIWLVLVFCSG